MGGNPTLEGLGLCWSEILKRTPKRYQVPVLWAWLEVFFSPKRYQFLHNELSPVIFCDLNALKGGAKAPAADLLRLTTLRGTKTASSTPKGNYENPHHFYMEVPLLLLRIKNVLESCPD